ncbi:MAG: hypothetical protein ACR2P0_15730 [Acidimicrobiales bacterium]
MHPIERLRYVARAGSAPDRVLVAESVPAITAFAHDSGALLVALRQLIGRQPESPGLLVLAARVLAGMDLIAEAWSLVDSMEADPTIGIADAMPMVSEGGPEIIESIASGPGEVLCAHGTREWIRQARSDSNGVVVVTELATRLPRLLWRGHLDRRGFDPETPGLELLSLDVFDEIVGPEGRQACAAWSPDCPDVAEIASF